MIRVCSDARTRIRSQSGVSGETFSRPIVGKFFKFFYLKSRILMYFIFLSDGGASKRRGARGNLHPLSRRAWHVVLESVRPRDSSSYCTYCHSDSVASFQHMLLGLALPHLFPLLSSPPLPPPSPLFLFFPLLFPPLLTLLSPLA